MAVSITVLGDMAARKSSKHFRLSPVTEERLNKLESRLEEMDQTGIVELAIKHLLATLELEGRVYLQVPTEPQKAHKPRVVVDDDDHNG